MTLESDHPVVDLLQQVQAPQQRRLSRSGRPDQADHIVGCDGQIDLVQHNFLAVALPQIGDLEQAHSAPALSRSAVRRCSQSVNRASGIVRTTKNSATTTRAVSLKLKLL